MRQTGYVAIVLTVLLSLLLVNVALAQGPIHWTYEGKEGPEFWGSLSRDFALCSTGKEQSPIDIPGAAVTNPADLTFAYKPSALTILNNGHTIQATYDQGSTLTLDGAAYTLRQFHFHLPSEHTLNAKGHDMELHFVHQNAQGGLAVVGVLLKAGVENKALASVWQNLPAKETEAKTIAGATINALDMLPATRTYWRYNGSLTTPPCSEGVRWLVMTTSVEVSAAQITAYKNIFAVSNRPPQPLFARGFLVSSQVAARPQAMPTTGQPQADLASAWWVIVGILCLSVGVASLTIIRLRRFEQPCE